MWRESAFQRLKLCGRFIKHVYTIGLARRIMTFPLAFRRLLLLHHNRSGRAESRVHPEYFGEKL